MHTLRNISDRVLAALTFFTRLPLKCRSAEAFRHVVPLWPLAGWLTGGAMAGVFLLARCVGLNTELSVLLAIMGRVLLTGALHEDGLADFFDGFGGGNTRERTLAIMKDSHIGTFGVLGLLGYGLLLLHLLTALMRGGVSPLVMVCGDVACKFIASTVVWFLPYARSEEKSKNGFVYARPTAAERVTGGVMAVLPVLLAKLFVLDISFCGWLSGFFFAEILCLLLILLMRRRIGGYTGDCCGATFLLTEAGFYLAMLVVIQNG